VQREVTPARRVHSNNDWPNLLAQYRESQGPDLWIHEMLLAAFGQVAIYGGFSRRFSKNFQSS